MAPETVNLCELECHPALVHLELADGTKIKSTQETQVTTCTVGTATCKISFTITKLLSNVDVVLGMDWLAQWNPVIDWRRHVMHIWNNKQWEYVTGVLLDSTQQAGSVKKFEDYSVSTHSRSSDWVISKPPKLWLYHTNHQETQKQWMHKDTVKVKDEKNVKLREAALEVEVHVPRIKNEANGQNAAQRDCAPTRQFISSKRMQKLLKRGETMYLAIV